jgi:hypothetical protein
MTSTRFGSLTRAPLADAVPQQSLTGRWVVHESALLVEIHDRPAVRLVGRPVTQRAGRRVTVADEGDPGVVDDLA